MDQAIHPRLTLLSHPLVQHKLTIMRRRETSTGEFRSLAREVSLLMAYELTRDLPIRTVPIDTPLEPMMAPAIAGKKLCIVSILRAAEHQHPLRRTSSGQRPRPLPGARWLFTSPSR